MIVARYLMLATLATCLMACGSGADKVEETKPSEVKVDIPQEKQDQLKSQHLDLKKLKG